MSSPYFLHGQETGLIKENAKTMYSILIISGMLSNFIAVAIDVDTRLSGSCQPSSKLYDNGSLFLFHFNCNS